MPAFKFQILCLFVISSGASAPLWSGPSPDPGELQIPLRDGVVSVGSIRNRTTGAPPGVDSVHVIVHFSNRPTRETRDLLKRRGVLILERVSTSAYFASVPASPAAQRVVLEDKSLGILVSAISRDLKVKQRLLQGRISPHARRGEDRVAVDIRLHWDASDTAQDDFIRKYDLDSGNMKRYESSKIIRTEIKTSDIETIADEDVVKWVGEISKPATTDNDAVRSSNGVNSDGLAYTGLEGKGVVIAQFETGVPDTSHIDFSGRVLDGEKFPPPEPSQHATHVAGTMVGAGVGQPIKKGVAPGASIRSYTTSDLRNKYVDAAEFHDVSIATNSWGNDHCHTLEPGALCYNMESEWYDELTSGFNAIGERLQGSNGALETVSIFASAGNRGTPDRHEIGNGDANFDANESVVNDKNNDGQFSSAIDLSYPPLNQEVALIDFQPDEMFDDTEGSITGTFDYWDNRHIYRDVDGSGTVTTADVLLSDPANGTSPIGTPLTGFNSWGNIRLPNSAKNTIVVGGFDTSTGLLWAKSSKGPTTDGRLKPDLVAPSSRNRTSGIVSTLLGNNYGPRSGTSTSTPAAAAVGALVTEWYSLMCPTQSPAVATLKAILLHSATDVTSIPANSLNYEGPDFAYGYGRINAFEAIEVAPHHVERVISSTDLVHEHTVQVAEGEDLKVTLVWADLPWEANRKPLDPSRGLLIHDLHLELEAPDTNLYTPWLLDPSNPSQPAQSAPATGYVAGTVPDNARDYLNPVEQVYLPAPMAGQWKIRVYATELAYDSQSYTIVSERLPALSQCDIVPETDSQSEDEAGEAATDAGSP
ncbi:MAG: S8 family serine peptidase [Gammaproteobacteria bacterium]|nr:S8 family serine peptidase [Gammaproteobacteria bacterium]